MSDPGEPRGPGGDSPLVMPLGIFGVVADQRKMEAMREELRRRVGIIPATDREKIANYLLAGEVIFAFMEHTHDVLGRFEMPGGSAIATDGSYFWRCDTSEYVRYYGIGIPVDFLDHGERLAWRPPTLTSEQIAAIESYLEKRFRVNVG